MLSSDSEQPPIAADACGFAQTRWSLIAAARERNTPEARQALTRLCESYWYPLYAYIRRRGRPADESADLTQEFFARLLENDLFRAADPAKGRFRAFLLASCNNFLANEYDRAVAQKRGGGLSLVSINVSRAEGRYSLEPSHDLTPEKLFERRWAVTLLDHALASLRKEFTEKGKAAQFDRLRVYLIGERGGPPHDLTAAELGMTPGAVKVAVHRMRQRYRELLRDEIAQTVEGPEQIDEEIRQLFAALSS